MVALTLYLLALASSLVVASPPAPPGTTCTTHTVAGMDSCHSIAKGANITVAQFRQYNAPSKIPCSTGLVKGTVYCVSPVPHFTSTSLACVEPCSRLLAATMTSSAPGPTPTTCAKTYVVKTGNTCSSIVKGAGIRLSTLFKLNPQIHKPACDNLFVGEVLCIVAPSKSFRAVTRRARLTLCSVLVLHVHDELWILEKAGPDAACSRARARTDLNRLPCYSGLLHLL